MLTKEEFRNEIVGKIDDLYSAYSKVEKSVEGQEAAKKRLDEIFSTPASRVSEPDFETPEFTPEEVAEHVDKLKKNTDYEKLFLTIGETTLKIAIAAAKASA